MNDHDETRHGGMRDEIGTGDRTDGRSEIDELFGPASTGAAGPFDAARGEHATDPYVRAGYEPPTSPLPPVAPTTPPVDHDAIWAPPGGHTPPTAVGDRGPSRRRLAGTAAVVALVAVTAGVSSVATASLVHRGSTTTTTVVGATNSVAVRPGDVHAALAAIEPAVVTIDTTTSSGFGRTGRGAGTGIVVTSDGQVLTNNHVIDGATTITVHVPGRSRTVDATVIGANATQDLALIQLKGVSGLKTATFASSATVQVGDAVLAVGNALGYGGAPTVTEGIISALNRDLPEDNGTMHGLLQTDAAINPGNSGGPLVDTAGHVIGINTAVASGSGTEPAQNIGFAIPSDTATKALASLRKGGTSGSTTPSTTSAYLGVILQPDNSSGGATLAGVEPGTPADNAGLQAGDVITRADGKSVGGADDLRAIIAKHKGGDRISVTWTRDGATHNATVTLATRSATGTG